MCEFCKIIYGKPQKDKNYYPNEEDHIYQFVDGTYDIFIYGGSCVNWQRLRDILYCPFCGRKLSEVSE